MLYDIGTIYVQVSYAAELEAYKKQKILKEKIDSDIRQEEMNLKATKVESISDPDLGRVFNALI